MTQELIVTGLLVLTTIIYLWRKDFFCKEMFEFMLMIFMNVFWACLLSFYFFWLIISKEGGIL